MHVAAEARRLTVARQSQRKRMPFSAAILAEMFQLSNFSDISETYPTMPTVRMSSMRWACSMVALLVNLHLMPDDPAL